MASNSWGKMNFSYHIEYLELMEKGVLGSWWHKYCCLL